jgi:hypothetical protein
MINEASVADLCSISIFGIMCLVSAFVHAFVIIGRIIPRLSLARVNLLESFLVPRCHL